MVHPVFGKKKQFCIFTFLIYCVQIYTFNSKGKNAELLFLTKNGTFHKNKV